MAEHGDQLHKMLEVMILQGVDLQAGQAYPSRPSWINYHRLATTQPMSDHMVFLKIDIRVGATTGWRMKLASFAEIGTAATRQGDSLPAAQKAKVCVSFSVEYKIDWRVISPDRQKKNV